MRLCGDIGGTKALLALARPGERRPELVASRRLACADFADFSSLLAAYLNEAGMMPGEITGGCLAVAGPIDDSGHSARLTNLPWRIDTLELSRAFGIGTLGLANDFAAAALGTTTLAPADCRPLQAGTPLAEGVRLVVGAGTGLGMATLLRDGERWRVLPGEGGHVAFAPLDAEQAALWNALHAACGRVTYERLVSGPGLAAIYRALAARHGADAADEALAAADPAAWISERAAQDPDSLARRALDLFLAIYGAFAGDMALAVMARGGVFLAGGIAARIPDAFAGGPFLDAFNAKAEHAHLARRMPVHLATDPDLGLRGAALLATTG